MRKKRDNLNENESGENVPVKQKKRFNIFKPFKSKYWQTKSDEEKRKKSILFGLLAILFAGICIGLCYPCVWLGVEGFKFTFTHFLGFFTYFFAIGHICLAALSLGAILLPYYFWIQGLSLVIMQLRLNRRFIGWLALIVWLGSVVLIFMLSIDTFAHLVGIGTVWFYK